ncbi:Cellulose binding domain-containing protein [Lentzea waywayandensis]|uniref:Cellulose binding domain-containing protein n=1 Tax=Lentzea waywayandensis TaxID=84724 RepID=A0A1I6DL35_9PSEU|nr:cellulose binding domain-containing protein [Lentzea waywayandensis]SFR06091.1 Cellulose binding domain-containing protein [Lentzea waywayandensis]
MARRHLLVMLLCVGACSAEPAAPSPLPQTSLQVPTLVNEVVPPQDVLTVVRDVIDGRTVEFADGTKVRIALLAEPKECFAKAALDYARSTLLASSVRFTVLAIGEVNLELEDGTDYAVLAVRQGALKPEGVDGGPLIAARDEATAAKRGLWGPPCEGSDTSKSPPTTTTTSAPPRTTTAVPPKPAKACAAAYRITGQSQGRFQAILTVRNTGSAVVNGWSLLWTVSNGDTLNDVSNATGRQTGAVVSVANETYNRQIASGGSVQLGITGTTRSTHKAPTTFSLNGVQCAVE